MFLLIRNCTYFVVFAYKILKVDLTEYKKSGSEISCVMKNRTTQTLIRLWITARRD